LECAYTKKYFASKLFYPEVALRDLYYYLRATKVPKVRVWIQVKIISAAFSCLSKMFSKPLGLFFKTLKDFLHCEVETTHFCIQMEYRGKFSPLEDFKGISLSHSICMRLYTRKNSEERSSQILFHRSSSGGEKSICKWHRAGKNKK